MAKTKDKAVPAGAEEYKEIYFGKVAVKDIAVVSNIRKRFDEKSMADLTENVRKFGVVVPLLLRQAEGSPRTYELIDGERRLRAAREVGLKELGARVLNVTPEQAHELQVLTTLQREGLGPIEEAKGFQLLLEQGKYDAKSLAARIDKSEAYVYRAIRLLELPQEIIENIETGKLTPAHGHQILRVPAELREEVAKKAFDDEGAARTVDELKDSIYHTVAQSLEHAWWNTGEPYADQPACTSCPSNTCNQGMLFDVSAEETERAECTDPLCFKAKRDFFLKAVIASAELMAQKRGIEYVGAGKLQWGDGGQRLRGHLMLNKEPKVSEIKADPKAFGIGVVVNKVAEPARIMVRLAEKTKRQTVKEQKYDWQRENAIRQAVADGMWMAAAKHTLKARAERETYETAASNLVEAQGHNFGCFLRALGVEKLKASDMDDDQLAALILFLTLNDCDSFPEAKKLRKKLEKDAAAEYDAKAKQAPGKAKAPKDEEPEPQGDADGEETGEEG